MRGRGACLVMQVLVLLCTLQLCTALVARTLRIATAGGSIGQGNRTRQRHQCRQTVVCKWVDECVVLDIPASAETAYALYSQLDQHPRWSPWLYAVTYDRDQGSSTWALRVLGLRVSWESVNTVEEPPTEISWKSVTGLQNRGRVVFSDVAPDRCTMTLTLSYDIPRAIAAVLKLQAAEALVKRTILRDLKRFSTVLTGVDCIDFEPEGDDDLDAAAQTARAPNGNADVTLE